MTDRTAQLAFGGGTIASPGRGVTEDDAKAIIAAAFDIGMRFFDTAAMYGQGKSELLIGEVLETKRDDITLLTKGGIRYGDITDLRTEQRDSSYVGVRKQLEESLERLRTDHVDIFLLHQQDPSISGAQAMENIVRLVDDGLAGAVGFSNFGAEAAQSAFSTGIPRYVEYSHSVLDRRYLVELESAKRISCERITYGTFLHGLLSEDMTPETVFPENDWKSKARRGENPGNSGTPFYQGGAFERNVAVAQQLREIGSDVGLSLAGIALAMTMQEGFSDHTLIGCRSVGELESNVASASVDLSAETIARVQAVLATVDRPSVNELGQTLS